MTTVTEIPDLTPLCPHCSAVLTEVHGRKMPAAGSSSFRFGKQFVYACPACRKVIGVSQRKGFWSG